MALFDDQRSAVAAPPKHLLHGMIAAHAVLCEIYSWQPVETVRAPSHGAIVSTILGFFICISFFVSRSDFSPQVPVPRTAHRSYNRERHSHRKTPPVPAHHLRDHSLGFGSLLKGLHSPTIDIVV